MEVMGQELEKLHHMREVIVAMLSGERKILRTMEQMVPTTGSRVPIPMMMTTRRRVDGLHLLKRKEPRKSL